MEMIYMLQKSALLENYRRQCIRI